MKKLCIGVVMVVLGLPGIAVFFPNFVSLIVGSVPVILILGGALAVYLGYEDIQTEKEMAAVDPGTPAEADSEAASPEETMPRTAPPEAAVPLPESDTETPPAEGQGVVGNTDTFVFHDLSCNFAQGKKCTARFASKEEAIEQGYKPCKVCHP